jgi:hypothetical protein
MNQKEKNRKKRKMQLRKRLRKNSVMGCQGFWEKNFFKQQK